MNALNLDAIKVGDLGQEIEERELDSFVKKTMLQTG